MITHHLRVEKGYVDDAGAKVVRLPLEAFLEWDLVEGDVVALEAERQTVAKVRRTRREHRDELAARIEGFTMWNAGVELYESVHVQPVDVEPADRVVLELSEPVDTQFVPGADDAVKQHLRGYPVVVTDHVGIESAPVWATNHRSGQYYPVHVREASPDGPVVITDGTEVVLNEAGGAER